MEDIIMTVIERKRVDLCFVGIKVNLKSGSDINTTDILFADSNDANEVFKVLSNHQAFDGDYNSVTKRYSNTISLTGELVVRCLPNNLLGITVFY